MHDDFRLGELSVQPLASQVEQADGRVISVEPRSMEVLLYLVDQAGQVCTRQEILDGVWGEGAFVGEEALSHCIWDLRRALGDDARKPRFIQTLPRRGYRLIAAVELPAEAPQEPPPARLETEAAEDAAQDPTTEPKTTPPPRGPRRIFASPGLAAVLLLVALAATGGLYFFGRSAPTLRVAVLEPSLEGDLPLDDLAAVVRITTLGALASLDGLAPLDPSEVGPATTASQAALATAADEVLATTLEAQPSPQGTWCWLTLRRLSLDGLVLWSDALEVPCNIDPGLPFADQVAHKLGQAYPRYPSRHSTREEAIRDADYRAYLTVRRRLGSGSRATQDDLETLEALLETSPGFFEGFVYAAEVAQRLARGERRPEFFDRAEDLVDAAATLYPEDPRTPLTAFHVALAAGRLPQAQAALDNLERLLPGDVILLEARARLLEHQGDLRGAVDLRRKAVELRPSWVLLYRLAVLEHRAGDFQSARGHLAQALEVSPGNRRVLSKLAELELSFGDLSQARSLYKHLIEQAPQRNYLTNLGIAHFLVGDAEEAIVAYRRALEMAPNHPLVLLNLAEALSATGENAAAAESCARVLELLEPEEPEDASTDPVDRMMQALCLARLGEFRHAVRQTQAVLQDHPENAEVVYQAAVVYALTGDRNAALVNVERALELGIQPRWFRVPSFETLTTSPGFIELLPAT